MKIRVYYEDTDVGGVVFYANYLKFCERARSEAFFSKGVMPFDENGHFFVKNLEAEYFESAKLGDIIKVRTHLLKMGGAAFVLRQEIYKEQTNLFAMDITLVHVDYSGKVKRMDTKTKKLIEELFEKQSLS